MKCNILHHSTELGEQMYNLKGAFLTAGLTDNPKVQCLWNEISKLEDLVRDFTNDAEKEVYGN